MIKKALAFLLFFTVRSYAQQASCGLDYIRATSIGEMKVAEERMNRILYDKAIHKVKRGALTIYQVPTVVHIVHQNGVENLADTTVINAINQANLRFQNAAPYYDATGNPVSIQFCLASIDPQGNPTTGITRDFSPLTDVWFSNGDDARLKSLNRWDPHYYYNIWSVRAIYGFPTGSVSGYSSLPSNAGDTTDGVVAMYWAMSTTTLTHECGHYLGLYHTFEGLNCENLNCLLNGDHVCDTPPDTSHNNSCMANSCSTDADDTTGIGPFVTDVNELPNYMDYTSCPLSFSQGQADRMENVMAGIRQSLAQSMGCGFTGGPMPVAQFSFTDNQCHNGVVYFNDSLSGNILTANWDFNNDGTWDSYLHNPSYTFPATGTYLVKLLVTNSAGVDTITQSIFVQRGTTQYYPIVTYNGIFTWWGYFHSCANWTISFTSAPGVSYLWSNGDTTQTTSFMPDSTFTLTCTMVDSAGLTWTNSFCQPLTVRVYPPPPHISIFTNDSLTICDGDTVHFHSILDNDTANITYQWYQQGNPISGATDSTYNAIGYFPGIQYICIVADSIGCHEYSNVMYVNSYSPPIQQSLTQNGYTLSTGWGNGNQWCLNGVPITGANGMNYTVTQPGCYSVAWYFNFAPRCSTMSDTICFSTVGLDENEISSNVIIYPQPATNLIHLNLNTKPSGNSHYRITDPEGRIIQQGKIQPGYSILNISWLAKGFYFLQIDSENSKLIRKILKD